MDALIVTHKNHVETQQITTPTELKKSIQTNKRAQMARPQKNNITTKPTTSNFENCPE